MSDSSPVIVCGNCGAPIEDPQQPVCLSCGSSDRSIAARDEGVIEAKEKVCLKGFRAGMSRRKGRLFHLRSGDDLFKATGKWSKMRWLIDWANDRYYKHIEDSDGNVVRHEDCPLSCHQGYGSAKKRSESSDE